jgi:hypothetical protein
LAAEIAHADQRGVGGAAVGAGGLNAVDGIVRFVLAHLGLLAGFPAFYTGSFAACHGRPAFCLQAVIVGDWHRNPHLWF